mmetsp:Transcript_20917/g.66241  ORF Transcript_20917/g.66241 Transcript_20917/m.66241 type:complete len:168 (-) Transcript_20917:2-505(-)
MATPAAALVHEELPGAWGPGAHGFTPRGDAFIQARDYGRAIATYDEELSANVALNSAQRACILSNRGYAKYRMVDFFPAIDDFSAAITCDAGLPLPWFNRGQVYYRLSQFHEAVNDFHKALELRPDFEEGRKFLQSAMAELEGKFGAGAPSPVALDKASGVPGGVGV